MKIREKVFSGLMWSVVGNWGQQFFNLLIFIVLTRLLPPESFGLIALAITFTAFSQIFIDQGMGQAIVQLPDVREQHLNTAFWASILVGSVFTCLGVLLSGIISNIFNEPDLQPIIACLSLSFIFYSLSTVHQAILQREMNFRSLALRSLAGKFIGGLCAVVLALLNYGVWSLVVQQIVASAVGVIVLWYSTKWSPKLSFSKTHFVTLFSYGIGVLGSKILAFFNDRSDDLIVGFYLGSTMLGYYVIAYKLMRLMTGMISGVSSNVLFSAFSRIQDDLPRLRNGLQEATHLTSLLVFPVFVTLACLSSEVIQLVFGEQWVASSSTMTLLLIGGIGMSILQHIGSVCWALGKAKFIFVVRLFIAIVQVGAFSVAAQISITYVALAFSAVMWLIGLPVYVWIAHKLLHINIKLYMYTNIFRPLIPSIIVVLFILNMRTHVTDNPVGLLAICVTFSAVVYLVYLRLFESKLILDLISVIRRQY